MQQDFFKRLGTVSLEGIQKPDQGLFVKLLVFIESHIEGDVWPFIRHFPNKAVEFNNKINLAFLSVLEHEFYDRLYSEAEALRVTVEFLREALSRIKSEGSLRVETLDRQTLNYLHDLIPNEEILFDPR
ncbi:hypothetical protein FGO68_gene44 [Halteria grandinella]|uniref:Uncharacterized protein n=1 Tax=Halteria grandinella TaxID=5974 RepID=A0A8J8TAF6_HALGN|nr:hypothetical protein FGO68_gene44 [Halteria grandinella]